MSDEDDIVAQDVDIDDDDAFEPGIAQPWNQAEVEELLYSEERPAEERLARLRALRVEAMSRESTDFGDDDPRDLLAEIDAAIARLEQATGDGAESVSFDSEPTDHRETLAPDSDEMFMIEDEDDEALEDDEDDAGFGRERQEGDD